MTNKQILIIEDDKDISDLISHYIKQEGFIPNTASNGEEGLWQIKTKRPSLIILDIMLPQKNGYEVMRELKNNKETRDIPVIILTAKSDEIDKVIGLELGADDYISKPFSPRELIARIKAVFRRTDYTPSEKMQAKITFDKIELDDIKHEVKDNGKIVNLTSKEYQLLKYFLEHKGIALSRDTLLQEIWGYNYFGTTRTIDVHVSRIKRKIPELNKHIQHIKDIGYKFSDE